jgi:3-oxoacyl-[acyl-carrier-protein] synthase II
MTRVVVTGLGMISGNGTGTEAVWKSLLASEARRTEISDVHFKVEDNPTPFKAGNTLITTVCGSPLSNAELADLADVHNPPRFDRHQLFALIASKEALEQSKALGTCKPRRFGIVGGTGDGGLAEDSDAHERIEAGKKLNPYSNLRELPNIFIGHIANRYGLKGPGYVHCTACAASAHALQHATDLIKLGRADVILVVGTEAAITKFGIASFAGQKALSNFSRPYQGDRDGFFMGEGAVAVVIEEREHAIARGATTLAEILGYGSSMDGIIDGQITDPDPSGGANSTTDALEMAGIEPRHIACIYTMEPGHQSAIKQSSKGFANGPAISPP